MDAATVRALGFILACNARVEGMRARNAWDVGIGAPPLYDEQAFFNEAQQMENIAHELQS